MAATTCTAQAHVLHSQERERDSHVGPSGTQVAQHAGIKAYSWEQFLALGRGAPAPPVPPNPEDLCTIMYTSGTTGDPKVIDKIKGI